MPMLLHRFLAKNLSVANRTFLKKKKRGKCDDEKRTKKVQIV
jgi:hypothetical protein